MALEAEPDSSISQDMFQSKLHYENKISALEQKVVALEEELVQKDSIIEGKNVSLASIWLSSISIF